MTTGKNIKAARERAGLTQEDLAERLDVSRQAVSKWEMGLSVPDPEHLKTLSEVLGVKLSLPEGPASQASSADRRWKLAALTSGAMLVLAVLALLCLLLHGCRTVDHVEPDPQRPEDNAVLDAPGPADAAITGICFYDETGAPLDPDDGAGWKMFAPGSRVLVVVSYADSADCPVYAASLFLTPTGTETFNERQQLAVVSTDDRPYALFGWDIPEFMMGHLEVRLECAGGVTVTEELNVGTYFN